MRISETAASSKIQGFGYKDKVTGEFTQAGFSLGAGAVTTRQFDSTTNVDVEADAASLSRIRIDGFGFSRVDGRWLAIFGQMIIRYGTGLPDVIVSISRSANTITVTMTYENTTAGSITVPDHTIDVVSYLYRAPW